MSLGWREFALRAHVQHSTVVGDHYNSFDVTYFPFAAPKGCQEQEPHLTAEETKRPHTAALQKNCQYREESWTWIDPAREEKKEKNRVARVHRTRSVFTGKLAPPQSCAARFDYIMAKSVARQKKILHPLRRAKTSRTITARHEITHKSQSPYAVNMDDSIYKFDLPDDSEGGVLGTLPYIHKTLDRDLEAVCRQDISTRVMEKKPASQRVRRTACKKVEVGPLDLAQMRQGQVPTLRHPCEGSMVKKLAGSSDLGRIPRKKDRASSGSRGQPISTLLGQHHEDRKHLGLPRDSSHSKSMPRLKSHHLQSDKHRTQSMMQGVKHFASSTTTALRNVFASPSTNSSSATSKKRDLSAVNPYGSKVEDVVDLCSEKRALSAMNTYGSKVEDVVDLCSDDDGGHGHGDSDGGSMATELSALASSSRSTTADSGDTSRASLVVSAAAAFPSRNSQGENDGGSTASELSAVASSSQSATTDSGDTSRASMVASAAAASPSRNSQDSYMFNEDMEKLTASALGHSRIAECLTLKEADDLYPGNSPDKKSDINVCHRMEDLYEDIDINASLNGNSRLSTTPKAQSRTDELDLGSSRKKARTEASPKDSPAVNWGGSTLPKQTSLNLRKANGMWLQDCG